MKFSVTFLLAASLLYSLAACGSKGPLVLPEAKAVTPTPPPVVSQQPVK